MYLGELALVSSGAKTKNKCPKVKTKAQLPGTGDGCLEIEGICTKLLFELDSVDSDDSDMRLGGPEESDASKIVEGSLSKGVLSFSSTSTASTSILDEDSRAEVITSESVQTLKQSYKLVQVQVGLVLETPCVALFEPLKGQVK